MCIFLLTNTKKKFSDLRKDLRIENEEYNDVAIS